MSLSPAKNETFDSFSANPSPTLTMRRRLSHYWARKLYITFGQINLFSERWERCRDSKNDNIYDRKIVIIKLIKP